MIKILNKMLLFFKNIMLPILLCITIYIVIFMFKRLDKDIFGSSLIEFILAIFPFILLIVLNMLNLTLKQDSIKDNIFYNITSFLVMLTITIFCIRALLDKNMYFWYKYEYKINFNYFSDQLAPIKMMLYGLSASNIILMISNSIKEENNELKKLSIT